MNEFFFAIENYVPSILESVDDNDEDEKTIIFNVTKKATEELKNGFNEGVYLLKKSINLEKFILIQKELQKNEIFLEEQVLFDKNYYLTFFINVLTKNNTSKDNWFIV